MSVTGHWRILSYIALEYFFLPTTLFYLRFLEPLKAVLTEEGAVNLECKVSVITIILCICCN